MVEDNNRTPRDRSPSFPYLPLNDAIDQLQKFYGKYGKYPARQEDAAPIWGLSKGSSTLLRTVAALRAFGLLDYEGTGKGRKVKVSPLGLRLLTDKRQGAREEAISEALQNPKIMGLYLERWGAPPPPKDVRVSELTIDDGFTNEAARRFIKVYDDSVSCAQFDKIGSDQDSTGGKPPEIEVGDIVQWESQGVLQFEAPRQVRAIQEADDETWVFVVGSDTGIPMDQIQLEQKGTGVPPRLTVDPPTLPEGRGPSKESEWLRGPLSKQASYRLMISGDLGPREISKLIKVLETQREILADEDDEEAG